MSDKEFTALKEQLAGLTRQEKLELAEFLQDEAARGMLGGSSDRCDDTNVATRERAEHMAWLKAHREEYAGQYVALDGNRLVGSGSTIREATDEARRQGIDHPFLTHISSANDAPANDAPANDAPFGGW